jgi:acetyl esterase
VALDDPRVSPLLSEDLSGLPLAYVLVAGFDLLRDEVREYARRLAAAGVDVSLFEALDLFHAFVSLVGVSPRCREALDPLADRLGEALRR